MYCRIGEQQTTTNKQKPPVILYKPIFKLYFICMCFELVKADYN